MSLADDPESMLNSSTTVERVEPVTVSVKNHHDSPAFPDNMLVSPTRNERDELVTCFSMIVSSWRFMDGTESGELPELAHLTKPDTDES